MRWLSKCTPASVMSADVSLELAGLSETEAARRLHADGPNELPTAKPKSSLRIVADVLREPMFGLLLATGAVYLVLGSHEEAIALLLAILAIIGITLYEQTKTERTLQALRDLSSPRALVLRGGQRRRIAGKDVVCGDVVILNEGDRVPADTVVLSAINLTTDESFLTGESVPVRKQVWDRISETGRPRRRDFLGGFLGHSYRTRKRHRPRARDRGEYGNWKAGRSLRSIELETTNLEHETKVIVRRFSVPVIGGTGRSHAPLCPAGNPGVLSGWHPSRHDHG